MSRFVLALSLCMALGLSVTADPDDSLGKYLGTNDFLLKFLSKFNVIPEISEYMTIQEQAALDPNPLSNIVSWEVVALAVGAQNKEPLNLCRYSELVTLSEIYETTGNLEVLDCILEIMKINIVEEINNINIFFLDKAGCQGYYQKPVLQLPQCLNKNCVGAGKLNNWKLLYNIIINNMKDYQIPIDAKIYDELEKLINSDQQNMNAIAGTWFGTMMHTIFIAKKNLVNKPDVAVLTIKVLNYIEFIAYDQQTSCSDKTKQTMEYSTSLKDAITAELDFIKTSYLEN